MPAISAPAILRLWPISCTPPKRIRIFTTRYVRSVSGAGRCSSRRANGIDILQSVWVTLLRGFRESGWRFADADQLRGFLFIATRNRLIDRVRTHRNARAREEPLDQDDERAALTSLQPRPSEVAQADEVWERLLACCPPEHHRLLVLRRQGHTLAEIAAQTGLHPDSVRRILRTLARQLAFGQAEPCTVQGGDEP